MALFAHFELFRAPNAALFDAAVANVEAGAPRALVVRAEPAEVPRVIERLREEGAGQIALTSELAEQGNFTSGVIKEPIAAQLPGTDPLELPNSVSILADFVPRGYGGVARRASLRLMGESSAIPVTEDALATRTSDAAEVYLALSPQTIMPVLKSGDILDRGIPLGSMKNLDVVIGPRALQDPPEIRTSTLPSGVLIGTADSHARAWHALSSGALAIQVDGLGRFILLVGWSVSLALVLVSIPAYYRITATIIAALLAFGAGMVAIPVAGVILPITELVLVALGTGLAARLLERRKRQQTIAELGERLVGRLRQQQVLRDPTRWTQFFSAAAKLVGVESSVLARQQADGSFVPVAAFGPASSHGAAGLELSGDLALADDRRPFPVEVMDLAGWQGGHIARLNSIDFEGLYWLYTLPSDQDEAEEIAGAAARLAQTARASHGGPPRSARMLKDAEKAQSRLARGVDDLLRRNEELERSLAAVQDAIILFDAAGIPIVMNPSMERLIKNSGLQPTRTTPVDLAVALTGIETDAARSAIGEIVRCGGQSLLPETREIDGRSYAVRVARVSGELLIEATDVTEQKSLARLQAGLAEHIDTRLRNHVEAIRLAFRLAQDDRLAAAKRERAFNLLGEALGRIESAIGVISEIADASASKRDVDFVAVNPRSALDRALARLRPQAEAAGVEIKLIEPALASLVNAEPNLLDRTLDTMLQIVIGDSPNGSVVKVEVVEYEETTTLSISGGFGLPADLFATSLAKKAEISGSPFAIIGLAQARVPAWGGALTAVSEAGEGYRFELELRRA